MAKGRDPIPEDCVPQYRWSRSWSQDGWEQSKKVRTESPCNDQASGLTSAFSQILDKGL